MKRLSISLEEREALLLERMAKKQRLSQAWIAREAIRQYVDARWRVAK